MAERSKQSQDQGGAQSLLDELPVDRLKDELRNVMSAMGQRAVGWAGEQVSGVTDKLTDVASGGEIMGKATKEVGEAQAEGASPVKTALKAAKGGLSGVKDKAQQAFGGGGGGGDGGGDVFKATNIVESIDIGAPLRTVYNQWTQYEDFPSFMKKVENVEWDEEEETKTTWKAQVLWSHRQWEADVLEQVPDEEIVWRSQGDKGHVDGSITFHELAPRLTRLLVVLEYYPQGFMERVGNIWRAQGRRVRLELKHFRRHVMMNAMHGEEPEGWRGEVHDGEITRTHDEVVEEEQGEEEPEEEEEEEEPEEEEEEEEEPEEEEEEEPEEEEEEEEEEEPEEEEEEEEPAPRRRRPARA